MHLILTRKTENDFKQIIIKLLVTNSYISKNLENKVNFFVLKFLWYYIWNIIKL